MARRNFAFLFVAIFAVASLAWATVYGTVRGIVHDPQHHPVSGAQVTLQANNSA
jgi:hypothetical protein